MKWLSAEALGLKEFDDTAFTERIDHVEIAPGGHITFFFKDGGSHAAEYDTGRKMPKWSEERRIKQSQAIRDAFTEERRKKMSERMKQLRKERGEHWRTEK